MYLQGVYQRRMEVCMVPLLLLCFSFALPFARSEEATGKNYYDALNLEPTATQSQIKRAFRSLALMYHPDKNKSQEAEESFRQIAEAYRVLNNKEDRKLYDQLGHDVFVKNASGDHQEEQGPNFDDIFHFFGDNPFEEEPYFMWSFPDDTVYDHHTFHGSEFTFVFSDEDDEDFFF